MAENQKNKDSGHVMIGKRHENSPTREDSSNDIKNQGQSGQDGQAAAAKRQQENDNETAGGREGQFSNEDSLKDSQEKWSPGAGQSER